MIVCRQCGQQAEDGAEFCPACGAFLAWKGDKVDAPRRPTPPTTDSAPPSPGAGTRPRSDPEPPRVAPPPEASSPAGSSAPPPPPASGEVREALPLPSRTRVRCLECGAYNEGDRRFCQRCGASFDLVMLSGPTPPPPPPPTVPGLAAQQPAMAKERPPPDRPTPVDPHDMGAAGGNPCPQCATPNDADRRFCRRCGQQLAAASPAVPPHLAPAPRPSWWRRLLARFRGGEGERYQQARSAYRRSLDLRFRLLRIGALVGSLAFFAGLFGISGVNPVTAARNAWRNAFPSYTGVAGVAAVTAPEDRENREFAASFALDGAPDTAWAATWTLEPGTGPAPECAVPPDGGGADAALLLTLPEPTDLDRLEIQPGLPEGDPDRANQWRPTLLELRYDDGTCEQVELREGAGSQRYDIAAADTTSVRVVVRDAAPPTSGAGERVAIGEVRLYRKS